MSKIAKFVMKVEMKMLNVVMTKNKKHGRHRGDT